MDLSDLDLQALLRGARAELADPDESAVSHLVELQCRGTREIFDQAVISCASPNLEERMLGVMILRELGGPPPRFAEDAVPVLLGMLEQEASPAVRRWVVSALGYQHMPGHRRERLAPSQVVVTAVLECADDGHELVRFGVAAALPKLADREAPEPEVIRVLIELSSDRFDETRYYALAALTDDLGLIKHPQVRQAVERRLTDDDEQIRGAARRVLDGGPWSE